MIVVTSLPRLFGFDALTVWPFVFITKQYAQNVPLLEHEKVHLREQAAMLVIPWLLMYRLSKRFRFGAEVRGHAVQVKLGGVTIQWAAHHIATKYSTGHSTGQAFDALTRELAK
jgi:hypothetical protein